jgi:Immunity protein YezG-like
MTDPEVDTDDLYQRIANSAVTNLPEEWQTARITIYMVSTRSHLEAEYTTQPDSEPVSFRSDRDAIRAFKELRKLTAQPGKGAWYGAVFTVDRAGKFDVTFDYDTKPAFPGGIEDESYLKDLEAFPRDPEYIPEWMPAR